MTHNATYAHIGTFASAVEAAIAYNDAAAIRFGEFSRPNEVVNEPAVRQLIVERQLLQARIDAIDTTLKEWPCAS